MKKLLPALLFIPTLAFGGGVTTGGTSGGTASDSTLTTTDITTNDVSISKHGFAPKAPNDSTKFLNGVGLYAVPTTSGVSSVTGTAPIVSSGGATPAISIPIATSSANGYLASSDWTNFNGKAAKTYNINLQDSPYLASGISTTTTTSGSTSSGATSVTVASGSSFTAGQGIYIAGAGASGADYIGAVSVVASNTLTVSPSTGTTVANGTIVQHDETTALQSAITALGTSGGRIVIPSGFYRINGPLQDTSHANCKILLPSITYDDTNNPTRIEIEGATVPSPNNQSTSAQTIISTSGTSGNLISGYNGTSSGGTHIGNYTNVWLALRNIAFQAPANPSINMVNANTSGLLAENLTFDTGFQPSCGYFGTCTFAKPTNNATAIITPAVSNQAQSVLHNIFIYGFGTGIYAQEHTDGDGIYITHAIDAVKLLTLGHGIHFGRLVTEYTTNNVSSAGVVTSVVIDHLDTENTSGFTVNDPSNNIFGLINFASAQESLSMNGGSHVVLTNVGTGFITGSLKLLGVSSILSSATLAANYSGTQYNTTMLNGTVKIFDSLSTGAQQGGKLVFGDEGGSNAFNGLYRGSSTGLYGQGNYINLAGYDGVNILTGNAAFGSQTRRLSFDTSGAAIFSGDINASSGKVTGLTLASNYTGTQQNTTMLNGKVKVFDTTVGTAQTGGLVGLGDEGGANTYNGIYRGTSAGAYSGGNFVNVGGYDGVNIMVGNTTLGSQTKMLSIDTTAAAVFAGTVKSTGYLSSDSTAGASATTGGLTFKNGLYTSGTATGGGDALTTNPLSQFAATTSAQLRGVLSDELGTGTALFDGATPTSFVGTNITSLNATQLTSGTIPAARLPNPSSTTLGGIQSAIAVSNQWINSISTSGVPALSQPGFSNLSGSVAASQMPALTGDVTTSAGAVATTIATNAVTNAKAAQMATKTFKGNKTTSTANAADLTVTESQNLLIDDGTSQMTPIIIKAKNLDCSTNAAASDVATITLPSNITRWRVNGSSATSSPALFLIGESGTATSGTLQVFDGAGGTGTTMTAAVNIPTTTGSGSATGGTGTGAGIFSTSSTLYIRKAITVSASAVTSAYIFIEPLN